MANKSFFARRGVAVAGFGLLAAVIPLAVVASPSGPTANNADCAVGFYWDAVTMVCVPVVAPVVGPVGPVGVGGLGPVAGPVGPVGVGGVVGPVGRDPILGPVGPVGVGPR